MDFSNPNCAAAKFECTFCACMGLKFVQENQVALGLIYTCYGHLAESYNFLHQSPAHKNKFLFPEINSV